MTTTTPTPATSSSRIAVRLEWLEHYADNLRAELAAVDAIDATAKHSAGPMTRSARNRIVAAARVLEAEARGIAYQSIVDADAAGCSHRRIAAAYGVSAETIGRRLAP